MICDSGFINTSFSLHVEFTGQETHTCICSSTCNIVWKCKGKCKLRLLALFVSFFIISAFLSDWVRGEDDSVLRIQFLGGKHAVKFTEGLPIN